MTASPDPGSPAAAPAPPCTLEWRADELLPPDLRAALTGPGAPFEIVTEDVLGAPALVFHRRPPNLRAVFEQAGQDHADKTFIVSPEGEEITYADAVARVARIADVLAREYGVQKGDRVGFASANSVAYILSYWAALSLGAVLANLNGWWTVPELAAGIELSEPVVVLADERRRALLDKLPPANQGSWPRIEDLAAAASGLSPSGPEVSMPTVTIDEDDPVTILFTSGTTGRAKGATLTHRNWIHFALCNNAAGAVGLALAGMPLGAAPGPQPSAIFAAPIFHVSGTGPLTNAPFSGMKLVLPPPGRWDETVTLELIQRHRVTTMSGVPTQFWRLLQHPNFDSYDLSSISTIGGGGAVCPPELARLMFTKLPRAGAGQGYGMSETAGMGTRLGGPAFKARPETVGTCQVTMRVQIRDPRGKVLPAGEVGEIYIWGAGVFSGYWNNPAATAAALDADRWYRTGDFGRTDGEFVTLESRMRDLIIRGGENIYPIEIENRLVEHPEVADAAVIGVDHQTLGQEVKAFIVPTPGCDPSIDDIRRFVGEALASFKVPTYVEFREALPYSATGKLLKRELEEEDRAVSTA